MGSRAKLRTKEGENGESNSSVGMMNGDRGLIQTGIKKLFSAGMKRMEVEAYSIVREGVLIPGSESSRSSLSSFRAP